MATLTLYDQIAENKRKSFLIIGIFVTLLIGLGYVFDRALSYGYSLFFVATIFAVGSAAFSYFYSDKVALSMSGARPITRKDSERLFRTVENLSIGAGIVPMPNVYLIPDDAINAFATGRDPKHASVAVTSGALNKLTDLELEGVIAHELSHVKNYDIRTMAIAVVLVGIIAMASEWFIRAQWFGGRKRDSENRGGGLFMLFAVLGAILAPIFAQLLKFALSRQREFLADSSAALLTRYPEGLASALEKIQNDPMQMHRASTATAHLYIADPLEEKAGGSVFIKRQTNMLSNLFSTHPPIEERIARLRGMPQIPGDEAGESVA